MSILVISNCQESTVEELGIKSWPKWTSVVSSFTEIITIKRLVN